MLPPNWNERDRRERADFLLNGRTIPGGSPDVRYFFYDYRIAQIARFVREAHERVKAVNPKLELSAAVFKNPVQSGRFLGQQWDRWNQSIDVYTPMTYRSHFAGSFEAYLDHLEETTRRQLEWISKGRPLEAGIATTYLYREELKPLDDMTNSIDVLKDLQQAGDQIAAANRQLNAAVYVLKDAAADTGAARVTAVQQLNDAHDHLQKRLSSLDPNRGKALATLVAAVGKADDARAPAVLDELAKSVAALRADLPAGFCPPEKLAQAIEAARRAHPDGIAVFAASSITREKLWPALEKAFAGK
jgi:Putative glycosyl hydrolase domain